MKAVTPKKDQEPVPDGSEEKRKLAVLEKPSNNALQNHWQDKEKTKNIIVEERFTFFQIENRLRKIATEVVESIRERQVKEAMRMS